MKIICDKHLNCTIKDCPHKLPHNHLEFCDNDCASEPGPKCKPTLKTIREEKLKRLNNYE